MSGYKATKKWRKNNPLIWKKGKKRYYDKSRKEAYNYRQCWTINDIDIIIERKDTDSDIAKLIGRSVKAIQSKRARIKKE